MASIEDRWTKRNPDGVKPKRVRRECYGQGLRWRVAWEEGGRRSKSFDTKTAAEAFVLTVHARTHPGVYAAPKEALLVREYAQMWEAQQIHHRASTRVMVSRRMKISIIPELGHKRIDAVTRADVQAAVIAWSKGGPNGEGKLKASTVRLAYTYLSGMMKAAVLDGVIPASPCVGVRLPRTEVERVRPLTSGQVQAIVDAIADPYKPLVVFAAATGMRSAEVRGLTWDRVDLEKGLVTVDRQLLSRTAGRLEWGPPKTRSSVREIRIGAATVELLKGLPRDGVLVFHQGGRALMDRAATTAWAAVRNEFPTIGSGYHQLRHHAASLWIAKGMSPVAVANILGHKDATETLRTYSHLWFDDQSKAADISDANVREILRLVTPG